MKNIMDEWLEAAKNKKKERKQEEKESRPNKLWEVAI